MKVQEFIEVVNKSKNKMLQADQSHQFISKTLDVKKYVGIKEKRELVENIIDSCILYEDGVFKFNDIDKYITFTMRTIAAYTNLELSDDIENDYDALCEARLLNAVIDTFVGEYENVQLLLQMQCDYVLSGNAIEAQVGKFLSVLTDKVGNLGDVLANKLDGFDLANLPVGMEDLNKLMEFVNNQSK